MIDCRGMAVYHLRYMDARTIGRLGISSVGLLGMEMR